MSSGAIGKDVPGVLNSEVLRVITGVFLPGATAISSWTVFTLWKYPKLLQLAERNGGEAVFVFVLASIAAGMILEDVGARIETAYDDMCPNREQHLHAWNYYLRTAFVAEPIGRRYAKSMVARLKFELGMAISLAVNAVGTMSLRYFGLPCGRLALFATSQAMVAGYLLWESKATHRALHNVRVELSKVINVVK